MWIVNQTTSKPLSSEKEPLIVTIDKHGAVHINTLEVEVDFLTEKLKKVLENRDNKEVFFRADKDVAYGKVIQVMAAMKAAGIEKLGMVTVPITDGSEKSESKKVGANS